MANYAKYWYKQNINPDLIAEGKCIEFNDTIKKGLNSFGFIYHYAFDKDKENVETVYDIFKVNGKEYLYMIYAEATQIAWKQEFERMCKENKIPIQKWMEG